MDVWSVTHRGAVRTQNQDTCRYHLMGNGDILALVCDGMGGARSGDIASTLAVETFFQEFFTGVPSYGETPRGHLERAATVANQRVFHRAQTDMNCVGMGTTLVAVLSSPNESILLNEGDSRAYYLSPPNHIARITRDHSLMEDLLVRGELTAEQALNYPYRNVITRALGAEPELRTDFYVQPTQVGDFLLLCSDGLSNVVTQEEMAYQVFYGGEIEYCCTRLLELALERGAPDNVTALLITCQ